jgi:hypothetical protein
MQVEYQALAQTLLVAHHFKSSKEEKATFHCSKIASPSLVKTMLQNVLHRPGMYQLMHPNPKQFSL